MARPRQQKAGTNIMMENIPRECWLSAAISKLANDHIPQEWVYYPIREGSLKFDRPVKIDLRKGISC